MYTLLFNLVRQLIMASAAKRPRKVCKECKLELSDRHFRRHISQCTSVSPSSHEEIHDNASHEEDEILLFSSEDEAINYEKYVSKQKYRMGKTFPNISEEDVETFFDTDIFMVDETSESSDYESDLSDYFFSQMRKKAQGYSSLMKIPWIY